MVGKKIYKIVYSDKSSPNVFDCMTKGFAGGKKNVKLLTNIVSNGMKQYNSTFLHICKDRAVISSEYY